MRQSTVTVLPKNGAIIAGTEGSERQDRATRMGVELRKVFESWAEGRLRSDDSHRQFH